MKIGIDIMGGDYAPDATIEGAVMALSELGDDIQVALIGREDVISKKLNELGVDKSKFDIIHASEVIGMEESPTKVYSKKPDSSIGVGFRNLKAKNLDAFCSVGNTGAMLVGSMYTVRAIPGVIRPSVTSILPKEDGGVGILLDVGTNADCKPDVLLQFAILGSLYLNLVYKV